MRQIIFLLFLLSTTVLTGGIEEAFKPAPNKGDHHYIRNIDFIYMINLDERPEKFLSCTVQLDQYNIFPYRFSAVNGWEIPLETLNTLGVHYAYPMKRNLMGTCYLPEDEGQPRHEMIREVGRCYFCHCMTRGAIGIVLSHLSILQDAYDSGYETVWIMEDDIEIIQDPHLISDIIEHLDETVGKDGWDLLFTDRDTKGQNGAYVPCLSYARRPNFSPKNPGRFARRWGVSPLLRRVGARYGAYSYIIRRQGMEKLLRFIKEHKVFLPYDMEFYLPDDIRLYCVIDDIVSTQPQALSDNGGPNYLIKESTDGRN